MARTVRHMGMFKDVKESTMGADARRAYEAGMFVFAPRLKTGSGTQHTFSGPNASWAEMVEAVEAEGWRLDFWAVCTDEKGRPEAHPLFRRT